MQIFKKIVFSGLMISFSSVAQFPVTGGNGAQSLVNPIDTIYVCYHGTAKEPYQEIIRVSASPQVCPSIEEVPHDNFGSPTYHHPKDPDCRVTPGIW